MFVAVLLAAGGVALEREEGTLARLLRGLVSRAGLLAEKALLAAVCAFVLALALLAGIGAFVALDWGRVGQWLLALACGALALRRARASRSACSRARCAPPRCSRSWRRCRWPSSRSCPAGRWRAGCTT